jgi:hypothetical protein
MPARPQCFMLTAELTNALLDSALPESSYWESHYPLLNLPAGAIVTGVYFVRIEDTDQALEVAGSREQFERAFKYFAIESDENHSNSKSGCYEQSRRAIFGLVKLESISREFIAQLSIDDALQTRRSC